MIVGMRFNRWETSISAQPIVATRDRSPIVAAPRGRACAARHASSVSNAAKICSGVISTAPETLIRFPLTRRLRKTSPARFTAETLGTDAGTSGNATAAH